MRIQKIDTNNFKGYDVRPLKGFLMSSNPYSIANEMKAVADKEGFKMYSVVKGAICREGVHPTETSISDIWAQDIWTVLKDNLLCDTNNRAAGYIKSFFRLKDNAVQETRRANNNDLKECHIPGGNVFIVKGSEEDELLIGEDVLKDFDISEIKKMYNIDEITILPQMDFHLDLFIRPLDNKKILLTDDNLSLEVLKKGYSKFLNFTSSLSEEEKKKYYIQNLCFQNLIRDCEFFQKENCNAKSEDVEKILTEKGFEVIKVPGRIYETGDYHKADFLYHLCNYMNANVIKNPEGKLVYITNKSSIDDMLKLTPEISKKIGFSFEDEFIKSISDYVDKEHVYFINGDKDFIKEKMLYGYGGGIHCVCTEIPE